MTLWKILKLLVMVLFFSLVSIAGAYFYVKAEIMKPLDSFGIYKDFKIAPGQSLSQISEALAKEGLIKNSIYLQFYVWEKGLTKSIKAGEYNLSSDMAIPQIADMITRGRIVDREVTVLVPEGLTSFETEKILIGKKLLKEGEFVSAVEDEKIKKYYSNFNFFTGKPEDMNLEGYLFPDTYKFYIDATPEEIAKKMLANFDTKFDADMRLEVEQQRKSIFEILTLASIVQEEGSGAEDMKIIAGIFWNRLAIGKALEADSTINFITGKKMRQALYSDLEIDSPYNTYKYPGLPPGPIANPGLDAIKATIWPEKSSYLYFLHTPEGRTIYSRTYQEHLLNKAKYLSGK